MSGGVEFWRTVMGRRTIEGDVPAIREALTAIAKALPDLTAALQRTKSDDGCYPAGHPLEGCARSRAAMLFPHGAELAKLEAEASHWDEDERFPVADWKYEVANDDTRQSYREWVVSKLEQELLDAGVTTRLCALCGKPTDAKTAHLHQQQWIGECCWDDRLKASE